MGFEGTPDSSPENFRTVLAGRHLSDAIGALARHQDAKRKTASWRPLRNPIRCFDRAAKAAASALGISFRHHARKARAKSHHLAQSKSVRTPCLHEVRQDGIAYQSRVEVNPVRRWQRHETQRAAEPRKRHQILTAAMKRLVVITGTLARLSMNGVLAVWI